MHMDILRSESVIKAECQDDGWDVSLLRVFDAKAGSYDRADSSYFQAIDD